MLADHQEVDYSIKFPQNFCFFFCFFLLQLDAVKPHQALHCRCLFVCGGVCFLTYVLPVCGNVKFGDETTHSGRRQGIPPAHPLCSETVFLLTWWHRTGVCPAPVKMAPVELTELYSKRFKLCSPRLSWEIKRNLFSSAMLEIH